MGDLPLWTLNEIAMVTGGTVVGEAQVTGVVIDSREAGVGDLFVPLKDKRDGHDFIDAAFLNGAAAAISEIDLGDRPHIRVFDSFKALQDMASAARRRSKAIRIGVTGSVGKTSIKEMIAVICAAAGSMHKSVRSFNNHWGVPLTMARMPRKTQRAVFEMGMNHAGELSALSAMLQPDIALVSLIAPAHLAHFDSVDDIAAAKAEVFDGLIIGGMAVLNRDDEYFNVLASATKTRQAQIISYGQHDNADIRVSNIDVSANNSRAIIHYNGASYPLELPVTGEHWIMNAAASLAATLCMDIDINTGIKALSGYVIPAGRGRPFEAVINGVRIQVLDESYNANPVSMRAALAAASMTSKGRLLAVLGDMYELGKDEVAIHAALAPDVEAAGVKRVILTGECMRALRGALPRELRGLWVRDAQLAFEALQDEIESGDTVLIKGSNASGLVDLVKLIRAHHNEDVS